MIYKELSYVTQMLDQKTFLSTKITLELKLLAKYYKSKGLTRSQTREELYNFGRIANKLFTRELYYNQINQALTYAFNPKNRLRELSFIEFYSCEENFIKSLELDEDCKKILFTILCFKKMYDYMFDSNNLYIRSYNRFSDLKKSSGVTKKDKFYEAIFKLGNIGLIRKSKEYSFELLFLKQINYTNREVLFNIFEPSFDCLSIVYERYFISENMTALCICGKVIKRINSMSRQKYCEKCAASITAANKRKFYENSKLENPFWWRNE